ncbi:MAG: hypothetical protein ACUVTD_03890 [Nitrososphaerales archaeon]
MTEAHPVSADRCGPERPELGFPFPCIQCVVFPGMSAQQLKGWSCVKQSPELLGTGGSKGSP